MTDVPSAPDSNGLPSLTVTPHAGTSGSGSSISQLAENLAALRDFVELIEPVIDSRHESVMRDRANHLVPLMCAMHETDPDNFPEPPSMEVMSKAYGSEIRVEVTRDDDQPTCVALRVHGDSGPFRDAFHELSRTAQHKTLLYRNALVSLVSYVEWFVSGQLHDYFDLHPGLVDSNRCLSLKELADLGSVEEARRFIFDQKVEEILRTSLEDWVKYFRTHLGLGMGYLDERMDFLVELFQRRNLTVHHGGVVNSTYLSKVRRDLTVRAELGRPLPVDREYVMTSIDLCDLSFTLIGMEIWKQRGPTDLARGELLIDLNFEHMTHERWLIAEGLSYFLSKDGGLPERERLVGQVNYWQSLKWQDRSDDLERALEGVDFDAKEPIFRFCLMALRDKLDDLVVALPKAVERGDLRVDWLKDWPIFRKLREHEGCIAFFEQPEARAPTASSSPPAQGAT